MKRFFAALLCGLILAGAFVFVGCGGTVDKKPAPNQVAFDKPQYNWGSVSGQTIVIWGDMTELERPFLKKIFERYQKLTGNTLRIEAFSKKQMEQRVAQGFKFGSGEKPDIVFSYGGTNLDQFYPDENFYDFSGAIWVDDLTGTAINQAVYNGKIIGLPYNEASVSGTLYNKALFKKYGIKVPRSQEEFMEVCEVLLQNGITPVYLPYAEISMLLYQFPLDSIVQDDKILAALNDGSLSYAQIPEMKKILAWYRTMSDKGYFGSHYIDNDWAGMEEALHSEKYAMMLCWDTWLYTDFKGDAARFGLMPAFMGVPEGGSFEGPNIALMIINRNSSRLDAAVDFITFAADPYNYNVAFEGIYTAHVFKNQVGSVSTPQYVENERLIEKHFFDSTAWLRIKGFSQLDATYIQTYMRDSTYNAEECLRDMDAARWRRGGDVDR